MISEILQLLRDVVNDHLRASLGWDGTQPEQGRVVFLDSERVDALDLKLGAVTVLLVNLEEDHALRPDDPYRRMLPDGTTQRVEPPIHMNAYVLFIARFKDYQQSLRHISLILQFFQSHRVLDHESAPTLSDRIEKLTMELLTLPFAEQNNLWSVLRISYQPSLLYKVRMAVFRDEGSLATTALGAPSVRINE